MRQTVTEMYLSLSLVLSLTCLLMSAMPESPAFLAKMGKKDKARQSLQWLRGGDDGIGILGEMEEIEPGASPPLRWLNAMPSSRAQTESCRPMCTNNPNNVLE